MAENSKLDAIRDIIFGQHIEAYNREFEALKKALQHQQDALEKTITERHDQLNRSIEALQKQMEQLMSQQRAEAHAEIQSVKNAYVSRADLGKLLVSLGQQLQEKEKE